MLNVPLLPHAIIAAMDKWWLPKGAKTTFFKLQVSLWRGVLEKL